MSDAVRVNGNLLSHGSLTLKLGGVKYYGFTAVEFGDKRERTFKHAMAKDHAPRGRTRGKYITEPGKIVGPMSSVQAFLAQLAAQSADGTSFGDTEFEATLQGVEANEAPITMVLERCVVDGVKDSHSESAEALEQEMSISYFRVVRNGLTLAASR